MTTIAAQWVSSLFTGPAISVVDPRCPYFMESDSNTTTANFGLKEDARLLMVKVGVSSVQG